jgi:hypothetical protein
MQLKSQWFLYKDFYIIRQTESGIEVTRSNGGGLEINGRSIGWDEIAELSLGLGMKLKDLESKKDF